MNTTAADIQAFAHSSIDLLVHFPGRSENSLFKELAEYSGLSVSLIRQFYKGDRSNLSVDSLDRLVAAIKQVMRKAAA